MAKLKQTLSDQADKYDCYQRSVQTPDHEVEFFERAYRDCFVERPTSLREDFCGTFAICCRWVASAKDRTAVGVDLCDEALDWGRQHNLEKLKPKQRRRVTLVRDDVRTAGDPVDIVAAQNFSFWIFKTRDEVIDYFRHVHANLNDRGVLVMDMMGGSECFVEGQTDRRNIGKGKNAFRYDWQQARFDPITHDATFCIHFRFADGSKLKNAFVYQWRFWSLPEVREMLAAAGFDRSWVYWENEDADGEGDGTYDRAVNGTADPSWICYVVAEKQP